MDLFEEKAKFIYENSAVIYERLKKNDIDTLNEIQSILLCDYSLKELAILNYSYHEFFNLHAKSKSYFYAISIIFIICEEIEKSNLDCKTKRMLRDKLRIYTKYFKDNNKNNLKKNRQFVMLKK